MPLSGILDKKLEVDIDKFVDERVGSLRPEEESEEYAEELDEYHEIFELLKEELDEEVAFELDNQVNLIEAMSSEIHYKQGLRDGIRLIAGALI